MHEEVVIQNQVNLDEAAGPRRSSRKGKSAIFNDNVIYFQQHDFDLGPKDDPKTFSQAMKEENSGLWYVAMKEEMESTAKNQI